MHKTRFALAFATLALFGSGCFASPQTAAPAPSVAPTLAITNPQNGASVTTEAVTILGTSDGEMVFVNGVPAAIANKNFSSVMTLKPGDNPIQVDAVNRAGTTTAVILVKRTSGTPATSANPSPTALPKKTAPSTKPSTAPSTPPAFVTFVSDDLKLGITQSPYGADLSWSRTSAPNIRGYALVKSTTDTNPYYPKQFYFHFVNDRDIVSYVDRTLEAGKRTYYRVCTIATDDTIRCGNVATVQK